MARVLYFTREYNTHDHRFLSALAKSEHQVYYLWLESRKIPLEDRPLPPEIEQVHWAGGHGQARFRDGLRLLSDLKRVIREVKPDLVQAGPIQRTAFLTALAGFRPLVSMSWGYDLIRDVNRNALWRLATRYTLKRSAVLVGDSKVIRRLAISHGMPDERIVTFPWGIDLGHFNPGTSNKKHPSFNLLSTRGWEPIYGVDVIAHAFVTAAKERPELQLTMLGNGSQAAMLRQIFSSAGLQDRVTFPGLVSHADLPRYYRSADLYISASHSDGTSISLLEAMACGAPAIVSDIPGNREWVEPGVQGWWFPDGDAGALTQAILHAVEQRDRLPEMGIAARTLTEERANWNQNFQKLFKAYDLALQSAI
jgi:glycosyltransferase involved in cell wall biosynthesis